MKTALDIAKLGLFLSGIVLVCFGSWLVWDARVQLDATSKQARSVVTAANATMSTVNDALADKNNGVRSLMEEGTKAARSYRQLADDGRKLALNQRDDIRATMHSIAATSNDMDIFAKNLDRQTSSIGFAGVNAFNAIPSTLTEARLTFGAIKQVTDDLDVRIKDPKIDLLLMDANTVTHNAALATTDGLVYFHNALFPVKKHGWARARGYAVDASRVGWAACRISGYCPY